MARKQHTSGFIYIWYDRKHKRYYVGSHWGSEDDGYICSSTWMRNAYRQRPHDFSRRIIERIHTNKNDLHEAEHRWLQMMKTEELKGKRYYNQCNTVKNHWVRSPERVKTVGEKIHTPEWSAKVSAAMKGRKLSEEHKKKLSIAIKATMTEERRQRLRDLQTGKKMPPRTDAQRMVASLNSKKLQEEKKIGMHGKRHTDETKALMSLRQNGELNPMYGKTHSEEARLKITAASKGRTLSPETRAKISEARKEWWRNKNC